MTARTPSVTLTPLLGFPEVHEDDDIADIVLEVLQHNEIQLRDGDMLVVSSKVVSKALGLRGPADRQAEVVLSQTVRIVAERMTPSGMTRIVESTAGPVMTAGGVDASNTADPSIVLILPADPDAVAAQIRDDLRTGWARLSGTSVRIGVILSDTAGRPWRLGQTDFALGASGVTVIEDLRGATDANGRVLSVTERCVADEVAAAADLVKGKTAGVPAAHLRGLGQYVVDSDTKKREAHETAVQSAAVQSAAVESAAVESTAVESTAVESIAVQSTAVQSNAEQSTAVQSNAEQSNAEQSNAIHGTAIHGTAIKDSESPSCARDLVRTGPQDWFGYGMVEAVRAALGVEPGSAAASEVGVPSVFREDVATRANRALRVALLTCPGATGKVEGQTLAILAPDDFTLGVVATRAQAALHGEGLTTTLTRLPAKAPTTTVVPARNDGPATFPSVRIVCQ